MVGVGGFIVAGVSVIGDAHAPREVRVAGAGGRRQIAGVGR